MRGGEKELTELTEGLTPLPERLRGRVLSQKPY